MCTANKYIYIYDISTINPSYPKPADHVKLSCLSHHLSQFSDLFWGPFQRKHVEVL